MIISICLNCSLDTRYTVSGFAAGSIFSAAPPSVTAGGKGLNLARVAAQLGAEVTALGLAGEKDLDFFVHAMKAEGVKPKFTGVPVPTRRCLNIIDPAAGASTEIREQGYPLGIEYFQAILAMVTDLAPAAAVICASGSVPPGLPADVYAQLGRLAQSLNKPFILDAKGEQLSKGLDSRPFAVKPNRGELEAWAGYPLKTEEDISAALLRLSRAGVPLAVVSLGADGAMAAWQGQIWQAIPPRVDSLNPVGSGDAFAAGLALSIERNLPLRDTLALATACGTANAMHPETGHIESSAIRQLLPQIQVNHWKGES